MILPDVEFSLQTNTSLFNKITSIFRLKKPMDEKVIYKKKE
jgi:hypothetical protein